MIMLKDITIGQYYPGRSFVHLLDPRIKIAISFIFIILIFFVKSFLGYAFVFLFLAAIVFVSEIPPKYVIKGLRPLIFIIMLTFVLNIFFTQGETIIWQYRFLVLSKEGLIQGAMMALRLIMLVTGTSLLTLTTSPIALTDGIESLLSPLKIIKFPAHELAMMMTIALRFIPTLLEETDKIMKAQMARGADFESGNIIERAKSLVPLLVPLFISAFRRADELAMAMESRCYRGGDNRTKMKEHRVEFRDYVAISFTLVFFSLIMWDYFR